MLTNSTLMMMTVPYAFGGNAAEFTVQGVIDGNRYAILAQPVWVWSMAAIKISVATMMLRLLQQQQKPLRAFLWAMVGLQIVVAIYSTISVLIQCIPLHAVWDIMGVVKDKKCWSTDTVRISSICVSSFHIVTDVAFAILPITFLKRVQIPLRERIIIGALMGLGIFASAASIVKAVTTANLKADDPDPNKTGISIGTWTVIEEHIAFIAACIPCLRKPFHAVLRKCGLLSTHGVTKAASGSGFQRMYGNHTDVRHEDAMRMKSMASRDAPSEENILGASAHPDSLKNGEIWRTTEVHLEEDATWDKTKSRETFGGNPV